MSTPNLCKQNRGEVLALPCRALYVHVPFCAAKCRYCDFYSLPLEGSIARRFVEAARLELERQAGELAKPLASIFLGGGTPTALGDEILGQLLAACRPWADDSTEFSVEANPGTVTDAVVQALVSAGVNRVNLGVQSFQEQELAILGRIHSAAQARAAVESVRRRIPSLGIDLIYGVPGQTLASWSASLDEALGLRVGHLSCYALSFEEGTPLAEDLHRGYLAEMPEELQEACYRRAIAAAAGNGMQHYEISNFALPDRRCRHNLTYWLNEPYLGIGPAATSYLGGIRRTNAPDVRMYCDTILAGGAPPATEECLAGPAAMGEAVMLGLRLIDGLDRQAFAQRYGQDVLDAFPASIGRFAGMGMLEITADRLRLADRALFVADTILAEILAEGR